MDVRRVVDAIQHVQADARGVRHHVRAVRAVHPVRAVVNQDVTDVPGAVHVRGIAQVDAVAHAEEGAPALAIALAQDVRPPVQAVVTMLVQHRMKRRSSLI